MAVVVTVINLARWLSVVLNMEKLNIGMNVKKYQNIDKYDSFITRKRQKADLERVQKIGFEQYNLEQQEKIKILCYLLDNYNDGRKKISFV